MNGFTHLLTHSFLCCTILDVNSSVNLTDGDDFNVADAGKANFGGGDVTTALLGNESTESISRRRTALHYDSSSSSGVVSNDIKTPSSDTTNLILATSNGLSEDVLPPLSSLFADKNQDSTDVANMGVHQAPTTRQAIIPQMNTTQMTAGQRQKPPTTRKRPPRTRKQSKRSRVNRVENSQQQQQQNGLLIMQKLLGSMTSLLRRDIAPMMTSFPVVTCRSPAAQSLPLSMLCAGAIGRHMPYGLLARPNLLTSNGPLMAGAVRGSVVRPVVWPSVVAGGTTQAVGRAPVTANASTSAPLLANSRPARQKTSITAAQDTSETVSRLELMTVAALREECRRRRLPTGGPKPNLIRRLQQNDVDIAVNSCSYNAVTSTTLVQSTAEHRLPAIPSPVVPSSMSKSSPTTTTTSNDARASLSQSQAIVARILSIRAAQRQRSAELAALASSNSSSLSSTSSDTSTAVVSSQPVTSAPPPGALPTSEAMCVTQANTLSQLNTAVNAQRPVALTCSVTSYASLLNGTQPAIALAGYSQQRQSPDHRGRGHDELWQPGTARLQQEQGQVKGQNLGQGQLGVRDAESQVMLCRQQQLLIYELKRQLEQSRRALIEAQTGEATPTCSHSTTSQTSPYTDVVPAHATGTPGLPFPMDDSWPSHQQQEIHRLTSPQDVQFSLQSTHHTLVHPPNTYVIEK